MIKFGSVEFWLDRVADEHTTKAIELIKETSILRYQTLNYNDMQKVSQKQVLKDLKDKMIELGWEESFNEYLLEEENVLRD